ncbi:hypothetical protein RRF57_011841 [Xylaria bambusicola]|uniref:Uncharacterized protein n=1 Tax=Xylaria bambusicola TaxID=326684 RepID=A0AAN7ZEE5_9PEZI
MNDLEVNPPAPARFFSLSLARRRSLELMYISPLWPLSLVVQLSCDDGLRKSGGADKPRSTDRLPMLWVSSCDDDADPLDEGRERSRDLRPREEDSRRGDLGAVMGEKPEGGFEVRMTGGLAARSAPYSTPKLPSIGEIGLGMDRLGSSKCLDAGCAMADRLVIREEMTSGDAGGMDRRSLVSLLSRRSWRCIEGSMGLRRDDVRGGWTIVEVPDKVGSDEDARPALDAELELKIPPEAPLSVA